MNNEAARAALTEGVSRIRSALQLGYALWEIAAQYDIAIWTGRAPTQVNPAGVLPREGQLSIETELREALAPLKEIFATCDFSWEPPQRAP